MDNQNLLLLMAACTFVLAVGIPSLLFRLSRPEKRVASPPTDDDGAEDSSTGSDDELSRQVYERIRDCQWELIRRRMNYVDVVEGESCWTASSLERNCDGLFSLVSEHTRYGKIAKKMPLVRENLRRLAALGFVVSEDGLWAVYEEPPAEPPSGSCEPSQPPSESAQPREAAQRGEKDVDAE